jgi:hypothetical protein
MQLKEISFMDWMHISLFLSLYDEDFFSSHIIL